MARGMWLVALVLAGCATEVRATDDGGAAAESGIGLSAGTRGLDRGDQPGGNDTTAGVTSAGDTMGRPDVDEDDGAAASCGKLDFLFVIDSSNSMATNQGELIASFPEFVATIQSTLTQVESYHVGVVTSDAYDFNEPGCDDIGALVTQTGGKDSGEDVCTPFASGARYMTEADDLPEAFACAARVGTGGDNDEAMMQAAVRAVSPGLNAPGECNAGFIRDDALLVLVLITDEDDPGTCVNGGNSCEGSPGDPEDWFDAIVQAKKGAAQNVVALSLTRGAPGNVCGSPQGTERDGDRIMQFVSAFAERGLVGDICADSFGAFFAEAVAQIETACDGFVPVG